ncbi:hypothetical protein BC831DRAFT_452235 [Entophlyctis helioformis]|nr:hypothetical protein BC831DRAFT_452235 [Entophlyctis helioformis]
MPNRLITEAFPPTHVHGMWLVLAVHAMQPLQYALIKTRQIPQWAAIVLPILIGCAIPLIFTSDSWLLVGYAGGQHLINIFRLLDTGFVDRAVSSRWSVVDYYEYFLTFETKASRAIKEAAAAKRKEEYDRKLAVYKKQEIEFAKHSNGAPTSQPLPLPVKPKATPLDHAIPLEKRDAVYYSAVGMRLLVMWLVYNAMLWYMTYFPLETDLPIRSFTRFGFGPFLEQIVMALDVYMLLNILYLVLFHAIVEVFGVPFQPMMDSPFISVGFRDFWSHRWNFIVKESLRRGVFQPTMALLRRMTPGGDKPTFREPSWYPIVGATMSFFVSGLVHEWFITVLCDEPSFGENMIFFMLQAAYTIAEVLTLGYDPIEAIPKWLGLAATWFIMVHSAAFFTAPFMREGTLFKVQLPNFVS